MKSIETFVFLQILYHAQAHTGRVSMAPRVLNESANEEKEKCKTLEKNAERVLSEFYSPASFDCVCVNSVGGLKATQEFNLDCKTSKSVLRNGIFGSIHWTARFLKTGPQKESSCVSYYSGNCPSLDDKEVCYSFDYTDRRKKIMSSPPLTCSVTVDGKACSQCNVCDGTKSHQGVHFTAASCTNISGMESFDYQCKDLRTVKDARDLIFKCPDFIDSSTEKPVKIADIKIPEVTTMTTTTTATPPPSASKSSKSKSKSSKRGKASKRK